MTAAEARFSWPAQPADSPPVPGLAAARPSAELTGVQFRAAVRMIFGQFTRALHEEPPGLERDQAKVIADQCVQDWETEYAHHGGAVVSEQDHQQLVRAVLDEQYGLGPLQPMIDDPRVENININGPGQVWVRLRGGHRERAEPIAVDNEDLIGMVLGWALRGGSSAREFSVTNPLLNVSIGDVVRLSAVMDVTREPCVSVRCHRLVDVDLARLCQPPDMTVSPVLAQVLTAAVRAPVNILVTGGVDAGKTTLLRALCAAIDPSERIATLESERELFLDRLTDRHSDVIAFESRQANSEGAGAITLHDMIPQSLRMNPRRIIVGEVRDQEIRPLLEAMNSGQQGSMATLHASSPDEVFSRILMLAQRGQMAMTSEAIHLAIGLSRPLVVHIRQEGPARFVSEVLEVLPPADGSQPASNHIFSPGPDGRAVPNHPPSETLLAALERGGLDLSVLTGGGIYP